MKGIPMKKTGTIFLLCCILMCCLCGCSTSKAASDCVQLCDYTTLEIPLEEYTVSEDDLATAIQLQLSSLDLEGVELTDDIAAQYFQSENAATAKSTMKRQIVENRFFEAARDTILESSVIRVFPKSSETYVDRMITMQAAFADAEGKSLEAYLQEAYEMTEQDFRQAALWGYGDYLILEALAQQEGYRISLNERNEKIKEAADATGMNAAEVLEIYGEEFFDTILYEEFLKSLLLERYEAQITSAAAQ
jgi:FKBP-type peptidyl-prolyl cis-trans isomerase (trigger factor)